MTMVAIVVAAGRGTRFGGDRPKQYAPLGELTVLRRTLDALLAAPGIDSIRCVIHPDDDAAYRSATEGLTLLPAVPGGDTRQDSVRLGLESLVGAAPERVLIHDAARPFVTSAMIADLLTALDQSDGAIPVLPVVDTLKRVERGSIAGTVDRDGLGRAQTPQAFRFDAILAAHRTAAGAAMTDDAAVAGAAGLRVAAVSGHEDTFKITTMADLARAERMLGNTDGGSEEIRCGSGFDVHAFGDGDRVVLCGVELPHDRGLLGHSDADVGLHAITDALLGAIADGDIGEHFPPSDPRWQGAPSDHFLAEARNRIVARGGRIIHIDVTLICERPKIGPHREAMRTRVAKILHIPEARVSVKATTTERLGFTGRGEGIAAQASATVSLPGVRNP